MIGSLKDSNFFNLIKYLSFKNSFVYNPNLINLSNYENKENIEKHIINIKELDEIIIPYNSMKLLYYNKNSIHNILYEKDYIIELDFRKKREYFNLSFLFYLILLIKDRTNIINYTYSIDYINELNKQKKNYNEYNEILMSKIIIELIENYNNFDENNNEGQNLDKIKNENNKIIKDLIIKLNLSFDIQNEKIDKIYENIIISLIESNKLEDYENAIILLNELEIKSIDITEGMYIKINDIFKNNNKNITNKYLISKKEDLFDSKKINFYYFLIKYILKNQIFIYQIGFLMTIRNNIIKLIKTGNNIFISKKGEYSNNNVNNDINERIKYIITSFVDLDFYKMNLNKFNDFDSNIINNKDNLKNNSHDEDSNPKDKNKCKNKINQNINESISTIKNSEQSDSNLSGSSKLRISFINENNNSSNNIDNINKVNNDNINSKISSSMMTERNNPNSSIINNSSQIEVSNNNNFSNNEQQNNSDYSNQRPFLITKKDYKIAKRMNILKGIDIKDKAYTIDNIFEISRKYFFYGLNTNLITYDQNIKVKEEIKLENINNIIIKEADVQNNNFKDEKYYIIICCKNIIGQYRFDDNNNLKLKNEYKPNQFNHKSKISLFYAAEIEKNNILCCSENNVLYITNVFAELMNDSSIQVFNNKEIFIKSIMKINNEILVFKSNKIASKGKDNLIFYNYISKNEIKVKIEEEFSFIYNSNGLEIFPPKNVENNKYPKKVLLCACKKYLKNQKNGILVVNIDFNVQLNIDYYFYDTKHFEVYCFCPILSYINKNNSILGKSNKSKNDTYYFLVGGFNTNKLKGIIKLFRMNYEIQYKKTTIEYIDDIIDPKIRFNGPISCITQSNEEDKFLISCWDGKIYSIDNLNINEFSLHENKDWISEQFF